MLLSIFECHLNYDVVRDTLFRMETKCMLGGNFEDLMSLASVAIFVLPDRYINVSWQALI
jgi:hypothetical protein